MSWTGIKKAINRAGNQVLVATGRIEHTEDKSFDFEEKRYKEMEVNTNKLQKEFKTYYDHLNTLTTTQLNLAESLGSFYGQVELGAGDAGSKKNVKEFTHEYYQAMRQVNGETAGISQTYSQTVINPVAKFNLYYFEINQAIKKRKNKQLDYDQMRNRVKKLLENPENTVEYEHKLTGNEVELLNVEAEYINLNNQLKDELPKFLNYRIAFLDPSFEAFAKIQYQYFNTNFQILQNLQSKLDPMVRNDFVTGKLDERIDGVLDKMKQLNITSA